MLCFSKKGLKVDEDPPLIPRKQSGNLLRKIRDKVFRKGKNNPKNSPPKPIPPLPNSAQPNPTIPTTSQPNPPLPGRRFEMTLDITKPYPLYNAMNGVHSNAIPSDPKKTIIFSTSCSNFVRVEEIEVSEGIQNQKESESNSQRNTGVVIEKEQASGSIEEVTNLLPLDTTDETNRKSLEEVEVPEGIEEQGNSSEYERNTVTHELPLEITTDEKSVEEVEDPEGIEGNNSESECARKTVTYKLPFEIKTDEDIIFSNFPRIEEVEVLEGIKENDDNNNSDSDQIQAVPPQVEYQENDSESIEEITQELPLYTTGENGKATVAYNLQPKEIQSISDKPVVRPSCEGHDSVDEDVSQVDYQGNASESEEGTQKLPIIITDESDSDELEEVLKVFEVQEGIKGQIREPCGGQVDATLPFILIFLILFIIIIIFLYLFIKLS